MELKPWEQERQKAAADLPPWEQAKLRQQEQGGSKEYSGSILPFSIGPDGKARFDINAGITGAIKRAITLPREVYEGEVDLNTDEATGRVLEAASLMSPVNPAVRAGDRAIPGVARNMRKPRLKPPTKDELFATAKEQYENVRSSGVTYNSKSVAQLARKVQQELELDGILDIEGGAKGTHQILRKLTDPPKNSVVQIQHLEAARRAFGKIAEQSPNPVDRGAASRVVGRISEFIEAADPASVVAGAAAEAGRTLGAARSNYAAGMRSSDLLELQRAADLRAAVANSGQNIGNSTRSKIASMLLNRGGRDVRGYTPEEIAALEKIAEGSRTANALRFGGNLMGGGGGLGMAVGGALGATAGAAVGGPYGAGVGAAIPPIIGAAMKKGSNALTRAALRKADKATRMRSALFQERLRNAPLEPGPTRRNAALMRALALIAAEQAQAEQAD